MPSMTYEWIARRNYWLFVSWNEASHKVVLIEITQFNRVSATKHIIIMITITRTIQILSINNVMIT